MKVSKGDFVRWSPHYTGAPNRFGFVLKFEDGMCQLLNKIDGHTKIGDKEYLFNNPDEYSTGWIQSNEIREVINE